MQGRPASAFVQDCMTPLEPIYRNPKTHTEAETHEEPHEEHPNAKNNTQTQRLLLNNNNNNNNNNQHTASKDRALRAVLVYQSTGV